MRLKPIKGILKVLFVTGMATFLLSISFPASAAPAENVVVTVLTASYAGDDFNFDNDAYRDKLVQLFSYSSYEQENQLLIPLERSKRTKEMLPGDYELMLTLQDAKDNRMSLQVIIRKGDTIFLDTVMSIMKPGTLFIGGPKVEKGVLILVLEALA